MTDATGGGAGKRREEGEEGGRGLMQGNGNLIGQRTRCEKQEGDESFTGVLLQNWC